MARLTITCLLCLAATAAGGGAVATPGVDTNVLPNPSFEVGRAEPEGWTVFALGAGRWEFGGKEGQRCVSVTGNGRDASWWRPASAPVERNALYSVAFWLRGDERARGGVAISGFESVNRDWQAGPEWERRRFFFRTPDPPIWRPSFRVGQWHVDGTLYFDGVSLTPALVAHRHPEDLGLPLGEGESLLAGRYRASHRLDAPGASDCRFLERFDARFNTNRWVFSGPAEVVYRHRVGRLRHSEPSVEIRVNRAERGVLLVEASGDGQEWTRLGEVSAVGSFAFPVLRPVAPSPEVWVRLRSEGESDLQIDGYQYTSRLEEVAWLPEAVGASHYLAVLIGGAGISAEPLDLGPLLPAPGSQARFEIHNTGERRLLRVALAIARGDEIVSLSEEAVTIASGSRTRVALGYSLAASGEHELRLTCVDVHTDELLFEAEGGFTVPALYDARGGEALFEDEAAVLWWCEPERRVSRTRPAPSSRGAALRISAAGNEYEPAQLVITPRAPLEGVRVSVGDLVGPQGARIPASQTEVRVVEYVRVEHPTDDVGCVGDWPDPLPPHGEPLDLAAGANQPFWITVYVPPGTPAGLYRGEVVLNAAGREWARAPLEVRVWGFDLPAETTLRSGFGLSTHLIRRYHNLETEEELRQVHRLYLESFASHRVSPYSFGRGIGVEWEQVGPAHIVPRLDFTGFDEDTRHGIEELRLNSFVIGLAGLGGGTFHERRLGEILGRQQGTPAHEEAFGRYARAVQRHLEERGWLDKAYIYWFDEPAERDFDFVREGMELIHRAAPGLTRMLTTKPTPQLYGAVDLWCLPTYELDPAVVKERQAAGEEIWWYLCTAPKAPYVTLFLDHYGTEMRLWLWQTWKYGIQGVLVWDTNYWTSHTAYPPPALQNPWQDAMSWTSGYGVPAGTKQPWGNGDGRFLYPPNRDPETDRAKYLSGPIPSCRWEALRDGIEDYEYFVLLRAEVERLRQAGADPSLYAEAERLLEVPQEVTGDLTTFTVTPEPIHGHRGRVAEAIERLRAL